MTDPDFPSTASDSVLAVVVSAEDSPYLPRTIRSLARQTLTPDAVAVVLLPSSDDGSGDRTGPAKSRELIAAQLPDARVIEADGSSLGAILDDTLTDGGAASDLVDQSSWIWILHGDSAPDETCLEELARVGETSRALGALGPKQRGWDDPKELLEVGIRATRSARRIPETDPGERDQGQFDDRLDVLGVGTAGMLLRRSALEGVGGFDRALGPFGDGLELSRRLRAAGYRVVAVPTAVVFHRREALGKDPAGSFGSRRGSQMYNAAIRAPAVLGPFLVALYTVLTPFRALGRLLLKDPVRARGEVGALGFLFARLGSLVTARRRLARVTTTRAYRRLEDAPGTVHRARRDIKKAAHEARDLRRQPSPIRLARLRAHQRRTHVAAGVLVLAAFAMALAVALPHISELRLAGGSLRTDAASAGDLWSRALTAWSPTGDGHAGYLEPLWLLASPLVALAELGGGSLTTVTTVFLLLAPILAAVAGFRAARAAAYSPLVRLAAGALWAVAPPFLGAIGQGVVAAVLVHIALPLFAAALLTYARTGRSSTLGAATLWGALIVAAWPGFIAVLAGTALVACAVGAGGHRLAWLWLPLPAAALSAPSLWMLLRQGPAGFIALPEFPSPREAARPLELLAGGPTPIPGLADSLLGPHSTWAWTALAAAVVVLLGALFALSRTRRIGSIAGAWILGAAGLALATWSQQQTVSVAVLPGEYASVPGWAGLGLSIMSLGLVTALIIGFDGLRTELRSSTLSSRHGAALLMTIAVASVPVWLGVAWVRAVHVESPVWELRDAPETYVPAIALRGAESPERTRTLAITPSERGVDVRLWRGDGDDMTSSSAGTELARASRVRDGNIDAASESLQSTVTLLTARSSDFATRIADHAVGVILVPAVDEELNSQRDALIAALDATAGLERITESDIGVFWRVTPMPDGGPARIIAALGDEGKSVPAETISGRGNVGAPVTVTLAERADPGWTLRLDGALIPPEEPTGDTWQQSWRISTPGEITVSHESTASSTGLTVGRALILGSALVVALPLRRNREALS